MLSRAFDIAFKIKEERGWDRIYVFVDLHSTVIKPNYDAKNIPIEFYKHSEKVLKYLTDRTDIVLVMYTCSHKKEIDEYHKLFKTKGIQFQYVNENPEVKTNLNGYGCYDTKPYMNVMIDDKAGFDAETEWEDLINYFEL